MLLPSCNIVNPPEDIPAYMQVDSPSMVITNSAQGTASQKIQDVWCYINENLQGVYEMPMTFPILNQGTQNLVFAGGVLKNGVAGTHVAYPFFALDTFLVILEPTKTYHFKPTFNYKQGTFFQFVQDFESGNNFEKVAGDTTIIRLNDSNVFEGTYCGYIKLDASYVFAECKTSDTYPYHNDGSPYYLEMNYKCNQTFQVGVLANTSSTAVKYYQWNITPKTEWNKIYLDLSDVLASIIPNDFGILIKVEKDTTVTTSEVFIDNIKLLTLQ